MPIRILLADDHRIVRSGLRALIERESDMEVVAEAEDGRTTVQLAEALKPEVVVMDITMPGLNGVDATIQIKTGVPGVKVLVLSMHSDRVFLMEMFKAGASGYLSKDCALEELVIGIRAVAAGQMYIGSSVADTVVRDYISQAPAAASSAFAVLTGREREVLQLLAEGKTTRKIAATLHVSVKTVESHRQRIMKKLGLFSVAELTKYAVREGLSSLEA